MHYTAVFFGKIISHRCTVLTNRLSYNDRNHIICGTVVDLKHCSTSLDIFTINSLPYPHL